MRALIAFVLLVVALAAGVASADNTPTILPVLIPRGTIDAAGLRRLAQESGRVEAANKEREHFEANEYETPPVPLGGTNTYVPGNDPGPLRAQSFAYSWTLKHSFRGNRPDGSSPLDPTIAAGPAHVVVMTNNHIVFYSKAGDSLVGAAAEDFFPHSSTVPSMTDPRVVYDPGSGRFFAMILAFGPTLVAAFEIAVSNSSDPTTGWTFYELFNQQDGNGIDYPYFGFGAGALYLSGNYRSVLFGWPQATINHIGALWVVDKAALVAATTAAVWRFTDVAGQFGPAWVAPCARWSTPPAGLDDFLFGAESLPSDPSKYSVNIYGVRLPAGYPLTPPTLERHSYITPAPPNIPNAPQLGAMPVS